MRRRRNNRIARSGWGVFFLVASGALASSLSPLSLTELTRQSDLIIETRMVSGAADWNGAPGASMLFTYWNLTVSDTLKGSPPARLLVRTPGGRKDGRTLLVPGAPVFHPEQEAILFLKRTEEVRGAIPVFEVLGWEQGAYPVSAEPGSGEPMVRRVLRSGAEEQGKPVAEKVKEFKAEIKALAEKPAGLKSLPKAAP